jgi:hypothetical protein
MHIWAVALLLLLTAPACTEEQLNDLSGGNNLSDSEIADGLRAALRVGTDTSTATLSREGGYLDDPVVRILLPKGLRDNIDSLRASTFNLGFVTVTGEQIYSGTTVLGVQINGLKAQEDALVAGLNHAAEAAAGKAGPIFKTAISGITIQDARDILFGGVDTAATAYLRRNTASGLYDLYEPKVDTALQQVRVGNTSVVQSYQNFVADYNALLNRGIPGFGTIGSLAGLQPVAVTDLSAYGTQRGLDGLFIKVAEEEKEIRENPLDRVTDLLSRVFGQLD